jgi:two-component system, cell cycle sensor histidine kinase and response regulator CckA
MAEVKSPLHILHLEHDAIDAGLIRSNLEAAGISCTITCVQKRQDFVAALEGGDIDLVFADFSLPDFDGMAALEIVRTQWPTIPFILISGILGEERAIDALKSGATDYVLKERLARLIPTVQRAMREADERAICREAEETVERERDFSRAILNSLPAIFYLTDQSLKFLRWNKNLEQVSGYSSAELEHLNVLDLFPASEREYVAGKIQEGFTAGSANVETRLIAKNGKDTPYFFTSQKALHEGKICLIGTGVDLSERKSLEQKFVEAQKTELIGQLAGGVAHDFNNILAVIMGYSDLIATALAPKSPARKYAEEIRHASERAAGLTRQLLVFSRKETVQAVVLDLNVIVKDLEKMLRRLIDENIEMKIVPSSEAGRFQADSGYVGQVLMNLVVNARDAMPNGGKLIVATSNVTLDKDLLCAHATVPQGNYVLLSVRDTGIGMTAEVKARLFEAFFTTKPKGKGTGLGLATCQTIVHQSGGHIVVYSEVGQGTTFEVYFPRVDLPLDISTGSIKKGPLPRGTETLLLVEDEPSVRHLASSVLEMQGYTVLRANNGQEGLNMAREHKGAGISLVVTDVIMPLMGGKVMAEWLKTTYPNIKILFTSGYTNDALAHHGILDTGIAFLPKPYTPGALTHKVRAMLDGETDTAFLRKQKELSLKADEHISKPVLQ